MFPHLQAMWQAEIAIICVVKCEKSRSRCVAADWKHGITYNYGWIQCNRTRSIDSKRFQGMEHVEAAAWVEMASIFTFCNYSMIFVGCS